MFQRVKQVLSALTAQITPADLMFVREYLTTDEQVLFWGMNMPDQYHSLQVAYTALQLTAHAMNLDHHLLVKCALLHDVGKIKGDISTVDKIITVLAYHVWPQWAKEWGRLGRGNLVMNVRHAFYIYFHHAQRSATLLMGANTEIQVVDIVGKHHKAPEENDPLELVILRRSDDLN